MKQRILLGKDSRVENRRVRVPRRTALPWGSHGFYGDGISFPVVFSLSFWLRVLPGGANGGVSCSAKMDAGEKDSGRWSDMWCRFLTCLRTHPVGGGLLVLCTVPGSPVIKQLMKLLLWCLARVGSFSQCASPNNFTEAKFTVIFTAMTKPSMESLQNISLKNSWFIFSINQWHLWCISTYFIALFSGFQVVKEKQNRLKILSTLTEIIFIKSLGDSFVIIFGILRICSFCKAYW